MSTKTVSLRIEAYERPTRPIRGPASDFGHHRERKRAGAANRIRPVRAGHSRGERRTALAPFDIEETEVQPIRRPYFTATGFHVAPHHSLFFPHFTTVGHGFFHDLAFHHAGFSHFRRFQLPTRDMLRRALPEGVLDPGGEIRGYLFFDAFEQGEVEHVTFVGDLKVAEDGETLGEARIPFITRDIDES